MQEAWKEVRNEKSDTNWVLFGYEGTTFDLKLVGTGKIVCLQRHFYFLVKSAFLKIKIALVMFPVDGNLFLF